MGDIELQAVEIKLDRTPRVRPDQVAEILGELLLCEIVDLLGKASCATLPVKERACLYCNL